MAAVLSKVGLDATQELLRGWHTDITTESPERRSWQSLHILGLVHFAHGLFLFFSHVFLTARWY
ncbi:MAG: hypothetical protein EBZ48_16710 [Proteobacteria bacterium]|nr:hypothetical protein [Pseudomonadota bacterium]